jgi:hypothetical protein
MKKTFLIMMMALVGVVAYANQSKFEPKTYKVEFSDDVKFNIDYDNNIILLNFNNYNKELFKYDIILNGGFSDCQFRQLTGYNNNKKVRIYILIGNDGKIIINVKDLSTSETTSYELI